MDFPSTLTIKLLGANRITSQGDGFAVPKLRITGAGTLTVKSNSSAYKGDAYAYNGKSLMIDGGCTVELEGDTYGIEGNGAKLTVNQSTLKAKGGVYDIDLSEYTGWNDCMLKEPEGAEITEEDDTYSVTKDGELVVEEWVAFRPATPAVYCTYTLQTTPAEASLLVMDNEGSEYKAGDPIPAGTILTVKAAEGWELKELKVAGEDVTAQAVKGIYTFTLSKDTEIVATFKAKGQPGQQFTLSFTQPANGTLKVLRNTDEVAPGSKLDEGSELKVIVTPSNGYELQSLTVAGVDVTAQVVKGIYTFTLKADTQIAATFKEVKKNIINPVESSLLATLEVYPNPFRSELHLQNASELQRLCLLNSTGQEVVRLRHNGSSMLILPTTDLPAGFYILRLTDRQGGTRTLRVVKR